MRGPLANTGQVSLLGARGNGQELQILGEGIEAGIVGNFFLNITGLGLRLLVTCPERLSADRQAHKRPGE